MENTSYWRFEDHAQKRSIMATGSGTLGHGTLGSCGLKEKEGPGIPSVGGLKKTMSMPILGPHPPCGRRVGDDLGGSECGDEPEVPVLRRPPRFHGEMESRLQLLERTFPNEDAVSATPFGATMRAENLGGAGGWSTMGSRGGTGMRLNSRGSTARGSTARGSTAASYRSRSNVGTPLYRIPTGLSIP